MLDGRKAKTIYFGKDGEIRIDSTNEKTLEVENENYGDYGICWVIVKKNNVETQRINVKYIETIIWEEWNANNKRTLRQKNFNSG